MTLSTNSISQYLASPGSQCDYISSKWSSLYNTEIWTNSYLRQFKINKNANTSQIVPKIDYNYIEDCYVNRIKTNNYDLNMQNSYFIPNNHSTPNAKLVHNQKGFIDQNFRFDINNKITNNELNSNDAITLGENNQSIPSISHRIDSNIRQKFSSSDVYGQESNNNRRIKRCGFRGIGCIVSLSVTDTPIKSRTHIQACSISVMIVAIIIISFVLVNFTASKHIFTSSKYNTQVLNSFVVPTKIVENNTVSNINTLVSTEFFETTTETLNKDDPIETTKKNNLVLEVISKIRKNIKTYPKNVSNKSKVINRDLSLHFCTCQMDEVCMLDENKGIALCKKALDISDPTGTHNILFQSIN